MRLTNLSFEEWIEHAFSREVQIQQAAWYFDPNHDWWDPKPVEAVAYLTRLFEHPERTLCWFSDDQDEFPCIALPSDPNLRRLSDTALTTMEHILGLGSLACQESALHGLGHWQCERGRAHHRRICLVTNGA
jgi:hypothetical protein